MRLVANENADARDAITKAFDWEHARRLEIGKWLLALGAASIVGLLTLLGRDANLPLIYTIPLAAVATISTLTGLATFWRIESITVRFAGTCALTARLEEIRPFLVLLQNEGKL